VVNTIKSDANCKSFLLLFFKKEDFLPAYRRSYGSGGSAGEQKLMTRVSP